MENEFSYTLKIINQATAPLREVSTQLNAVTNQLAALTTTMSETTAANKRVTDGMGDFAQKMFGFEQITNAVRGVNEVLQEATAPGRALNTQLAELSAITGVTGRGLDDIGKRARGLSKDFGVDAAGAADSFKIILSQLAPEIANQPAALDLMGRHVATLSKQMRGDTAAAAEVLTTAMNSFDVSLKNPMTAAAEMGRMMDIMSEAARQGSAEMPRIKNALANVGAVAKSSGLDFETMNAAIQYLDKGSLKGAEGGVALRNVLMKLNGVNAAPKEARDAMKAYGVDMDLVADTSKSLTERLNEMKKIQNDKVAMEKVFTAENYTATLVLMNKTEAIGKMAEGLNNKGVAMKMAKTIMESYEERMKRSQARIDDFKISMFNATQGFLPYIQYATQALIPVAQMMPLLDVSVRGYKATRDALKEVSLATRIQSIWTGVHGFVTGVASWTTQAWKKSIDGVRNSLISLSLGSTILGMVAYNVAARSASAATRGFSMAIMSIPVLGWIAAGITAAAAGFAWLWENSRGFRATMYGVWEVIKYIGSIVWDVLVWPYATLWKYLKFLWPAIKSGFLAMVNSVKGFFVGIWDGIVLGASMVWEAISWPWRQVFALISPLADWIEEKFGGVFRKIGQIFSAIWQGVKAEFEKIIKPIQDLWAAFMKWWGKSDVKKKFVEGYEKGAAAFDADQTKDSGDPLTGRSSQVRGLGKRLDETKGKNEAIAPTMPKGLDSGSGSGSGKTVTVNIQNILPNLTIQTVNMGESVTKIKQMVLDAVVSAVHDGELSIGG